MNNYFQNLFKAQKFLASIDYEIDPDDVPGGSGGGGTPPPTFVPGYVGYSVPRYTCNVAVTEEIKVMDFINEVLFPSARMFTSQGANGKIRLRNKKPTTWGLATAALATDDNEIALDDVSGWITNPNNLLLIDPYTDKSEIHTIDEVNYSTAQNSVTLTGSANLTITGFAGASGAIPATASVTVASIASGTPSNLTLDGVVFGFTATGADSMDGIAGFLAAAINSHPKTARRFWAISSGADLIITAKFGVITLAGNLTENHAAPVANPATAPVLTAVSGVLKAGVYKVAYSFVNMRGQTLLSPVASVTLTDDQNISVSAITPPSGCTVNWYIQPQPGVNKLRLQSNNDGATFVINELPLLIKALPPDFNRTGAEVMRIFASFSDRKLTRAQREASNVFRGSFEWLLGNRSNKSINRIDLKYRDAFQDYRLIELRISDDENIKKVKNTANLEINGQAIDNTFQATRIGLSLLAEYRDADFFYVWKASRAALLLEEGDVVAITDAGSGVVNLPVMIEGLEFDLARESIPKVKFTARKYSSSLYDDSITDRKIKTVIET